MERKDIIVIGTELKAARMESGLSRRAAGEALALHPKSIEAYESGHHAPAPAVVMAMAKLYGQPCLNQRYCRCECAIGASYSYEMLNNVDRSPQNILLKLHQVHREAGEAIGRMLSTVINKQQACDFTDGEQRSIKRDLHDLMDLEHTIETLKMELGERQWCDIPQLVSEHNSKCFDRGYVVHRAHGVVREVEQIYAYGVAG